MTEGEFPFRSFTMRSEGYDRGEVDSYVDELRSEIVEQRRALETATDRGDGHADARLHDPEGAVTRTLAIAQETADRVLHDAQVEADRRRAEADEHVTNTLADADERAARLLADMEAQAAEVREQGVAAARSAIQVERDKAMAELAHVRRVRDDLRTEAVDLKAALDRYRSQAREASDTLSSVASGPLMSLDLPDFIDDDVVLAGIVEDRDEPESYDASEQPFGDDEVDDGDDMAMPESSHLRSVTLDADDAVLSGDDFDDDDEPVMLAGDGGVDPVFADDEPVLAVAEDYEPGDVEAGNEDLADVIAIDSDTSRVDETFDVASDLDGDIEFGSENEADTDDSYTGAPVADEDEAGSGAFLAEVRAAAEDDELVPPEAEESDRFLSELRGLADSDDEGFESEAADRFFDDD